MTQTRTAVQSPAETWQQVDPREHDVRLVVCDMDGTLLGLDGLVPDGFAEVLAELTAADITFVPASGRPFPTLHRMFEQFDQITTFVSENGSLVVRDDQVVSMSTVSQASAEQIIDLAHASGRNLGVILCGRKGAWVERTDAEFVAEVGEYFKELSTVTDLRSVEDDLLKVAIYDFGDPAELKRDVLGPVEGDHQVVVSAEHWIDIMVAGANKGSAVTGLQQKLGITRAQTVAFGDYFNDAEMLDAAELSFAIGNAHPGIKERARYIAPTNAEQGVLTVLRHLLDK